MRGPELVLHHIGFSRSTAVLWMLEELSQSYKVVSVDRDRENIVSKFYVN